MIRVAKLLAVSSGAAGTGHGVVALFIAGLVILIVEKIAMSEIRKLNIWPRTRLP